MHDRPDPQSLAVDADFVIEATIFKTKVTNQNRFLSVVKVEFKVETKTANIIVELHASIRTFMHA